MQLSLKVTDLIELEKLTKFVSKSKERFKNINLNNKNGRLVAQASDSYCLRSVELSDVRRLSSINTCLVVDASLLNALKTLIAEFKKYPEQTIEMTDKTVGANDLHFKINYSQEIYPDFELDENVHSYFSVNLKALKLAIGAMNGDTAFFVLPQAQSDRIFIRNKGGEFVAIGVTTKGEV